MAARRARIQIKPNIRVPKPGVSAPKAADAGKTKATFVTKQEIKYESSSEASNSSFKDTAKETVEDVKSHDAEARIPQDEPDASADVADAAFGSACSADETDQTPEDQNTCRVPKSDCESVLTRSPSPPAPLSGSASEATVLLDDENSNVSSAHEELGGLEKNNSDEAVEPIAAAASAESVGPERPNVPSAKESPKKTRVDGQAASHSEGSSPCKKGVGSVDKTAEPLDHGHSKSGDHAVSRGSEGFHKTDRPRAESGKRFDVLSVRKRRAPIDKQKLPSTEEPPPKTLRMRDLIYWNPKSNRMSTTSSGKKDKNNTKRTGSQASNAARVEGLEDFDSNFIPPQVKIGPDGNIVLDENIFQERSMFEDLPIVEEDENDRVLNSHSFRKNRTLTKYWTKRETAKFYIALSMVGTDFTLMQGELFPKRSRKELKNKFKREERANRRLIDTALKNRQPINKTVFIEEEMDEEAEKERKREEREKKRQEKAEAHLQLRQEREAKRKQILEERAREPREVPEPRKSGRKRKNFKQVDYIFDSDLEEDSMEVSPSTHKDPRTEVGEILLNMSQCGREPGVTAKASSRSSPSPSLPEAVPRTEASTPTPTSIPKADPHRMTSAQQPPAPTEPAAIVPGAVAAPQSEGAVSVPSVGALSVGAPLDSEATQWVPVQQCVVAGDAGGTITRPGVDPSGNAIQIQMPQEALLNLHGARMVDQVVDTTQGPCMQRLLLLPDRTQNGCMVHIYILPQDATVNIIQPPTASSSLCQMVVPPSTLDPSRPGQMQFFNVADAGSVRMQVEATQAEAPPLGGVPESHPSHSGTGTGPLEPPTSAPAPFQSAPTNPPPCSAPGQQGCGTDEDCKSETPWKTESADHLNTSQVVWKQVLQPTAATEIPGEIGASTEKLALTFAAVSDSVASKVVSPSDCNFLLRPEDASVPSGTVPGPVSVTTSKSASSAESDCNFLLVSKSDVDTYTASEESGYGSQILSSPRSSGDIFVVEQSNLANSSHDCISVHSSENVPALSTGCFSSVTSKAVEQGSMEGRTGTRQADTAVLLQHTGFPGAKKQEECQMDTDAGVLTQQLSVTESSSGAEVTPRAPLGPGGVCPAGHDCACGDSAQAGVITNGVALVQGEVAKMESESVTLLERTAAKAAGQDGWGSGGNGEAGLGS